MSITVRLDRLRLDGNTQPRVAISEETVQEYADLISEGTELPAVDVFHDGADYWLADGFHRYHAVKRVGFIEIAATLHAGTRREAVLFSVGVNHAHGLKRSNADKRKAVMTLLEDDEWRQWSDSEIARRCGVAHTYVGDVRRGYRRESSSLVLGTSEPRRRTVRTKHGTETTMDISNIGKSYQPSMKVPAEKIVEVERRLRDGEAVTAIAKSLRIAPETIGKIRDAASIDRGRPDNSRTAVELRKEQMRQMAAAGHSSRQIAETLGYTEEACRNIIRTAGIDVPADRATRNTRKLDATRIVENIVMDADHLTADVGLIGFAELDREQIGDWIDSLRASHKKLAVLIQRLIKEQQKHEQVA